MTSRHPRPAPPLLPRQRSAAFETAALLFPLTDAVVCLVLVLVLLWLRRRLRIMISAASGCGPDTDGSVAPGQASPRAPVSAAQYSVLVTGLPPGVTVTQLLTHFHGLCVQAPASVHHGTWLPLVGVGGGWGGAIVCVWASWGRWGQGATGTCGSPVTLMLLRLELVLALDHLCFAAPSPPPAPTALPQLQPVWAGLDLPGLLLPLCWPQDPAAKDRRGNVCQRNGAGCVERVCMCACVHARHRLCASRCAGG